MLHSRQFVGTRHRRKEGDGVQRHRRTKRPLKIGLFFPHAQVGPDGRKPAWESILGLAQRAEEVGFDSLWFPDHFFYPRGELGLNPDGTPRTEKEAASGFWDCWTLMTAHRGQRAARRTRHT